MFHSSRESAAPPLTPEQYVRIYEVLYSTLNPVARVQVACIPFAIGGAMLLNEFHGVKAEFYAGAALYDVGAESQLAFGKMEDGYFVSSRYSFHCWIETETYAIDLMAPIFRECLAHAGRQIALPRRMFQKLLSVMAEKLSDVRQPGDFALQQDRDLTQLMIDEFLEDEVKVEWLAACRAWYRPYPQPLPTLKLRESDGSVAMVSLNAPSIAGAW